jgi:transposase, IS30 family
MPETIYQAIYVQGRGELCRELHPALRTGRARRRPRRTTALACGRLADMVLISQRPAEAADRAVPATTEGDLIMGAGGNSAIGNLIERSSRYVTLLHLPKGKTSTDVRDALITSPGTLPTPTRRSSTVQQLRRSLTWDQGKEMARHREFSLATDMQVYFCDPHSPWQPLAARHQREASTVCYASTFRKAPTYLPTAPRTWLQSRPNSTHDHAKPSTGRHQPNAYKLLEQAHEPPVLQPPLDSAS